MRVPISELQPGDMIDLEGDIYADPKHNRVEFETEYAIVEAVEPETPACTAVWIEGVDCFGFPPEHLVERA